jgi:hypothetical protein
LLVPARRGNPYRLHVSRLNLHASDSVFLSSPFLLFAYCCLVAHLRPSLLFGARMCAFHLVLPCSLLFLSFICHLITVHINTNRHDITFALLAYLFVSLCCFCLYLPLQCCKVSLYAHCHSLAQIPDISVMQYNIAILGGRWSPMLMLYSLCGDCKENKIIMCYECCSRRGRVSNDKVEKGFTRALKKQRGGC